VEDDGVNALRADLAFIEQVFRGERCYVVKDLAAQKYFRFGATEVRVMRAFDGHRTARAIVALLAQEGIRLSVQAIDSFATALGSAGLLERSLRERSVLQLERLRAERHKRRRRPLFRGELLRMRWSFGDPDALLARLLPRIRWMFTPGFVALSALLFAAYGLVMADRWDEFAATLSATYSWSAIDAGSVLVLCLTGFVVVLIHELGHGLTCKHFGGEVHELGFMLIYLQPAFYCDVSDAWSFPEKRARLWVTAAGSWIQLVVASLAAIVWFVVAPDTLVAEVCVATMLIGGLMTVVANMNPLLPLDGYFLLADWLEIPNLRQLVWAGLVWRARGWMTRAWRRRPRVRPALAVVGLAVAVVTGLLVPSHITSTGTFVVYPTSRADSVEVRLALGPGATLVRAGQVVHLISYADVAAPWTGPVSRMSDAAEPVVRLTASDAWRPGVHGEASVELGQTTVLGALWWSLRRTLRADLWL
jgi:hypothetical protein